MRRKWQIMKNREKIKAMVSKNFHGWLPFYDYFTMSFKNFEFFVVDIFLFFWLGLLLLSIL